MKGPTVAEYRKLIDPVIDEALRPKLEEAGFAGRGLTYRRTQSGIRQSVELGFSRNGSLSPGAALFNMYIGIEPMVVADTFSKLCPIEEKPEIRLPIDVVGPPGKPWWIFDSRRAFVDLVPSLEVWLSRDAISYLDARQVPADLLVRTKESVLGPWKVDYQQGGTLPAIGAALALDSGDPGGALELLEAGYGTDPHMRKKRAAAFDYVNAAISSGV